MTQYQIRIRARAGGQQVDNTYVKAVTEGPGVRQDLRRRAQRVMQYQKDHVGVKTGRLRGTIRIEEGGSDRGAASVTVMAGRTGATPYLGWHTEGTEPHGIAPRGTGYPLRFYWAKVGAWVAMSAVSHPGNPPNRFIQESARYWVP